MKNTQFMLRIDEELLQQFDEAIAKDINVEQNRSAVIRLLIRKYIQEIDSRG